MVLTRDGAAHRSRFRLGRLSAGRHGNSRRTAEQGKLWPTVVVATEMWATVLNTILADLYAAVKYSQGYNSTPIKKLWLCE